MLEYRQHYSLTIPEISLIKNYASPQMTESRAYFHTSLSYGAYYAVSAFAFSVIIYFTLGNPLGVLSWLGVWIPVLFICLAIKNHRDKHSFGNINYWEAFKVGFYTIVYGGALYAMLVYVFGVTIAQQMVDDYKMQVYQQTEEIQKYFLFNENFIDKMLDGIEKTTLGSLLSGDYINKIIGGAIVSLIAAGVYKKNKLPTDIAT